MTSSRAHSTKPAGFCTGPLPLAMLLTVMVLLAHGDLLGQKGGHGTIRGVVVDDSTRSPLESADVILLRTKDSTMVTGIATDASGRFEFTRVPWDEYFVRLRRVGHRQRTTPSFVIDEQHRHLNLGKMTLQATLLTLDEVTVTAEGPQLTFSPVGMTYHVDQDVLSETATVSELLEDIPSVQVDINGEVSLRGSSRVLLMINGKKSPVLEKQEGAFLDELPADLVEKIEVITTPSAKYRAEGKSGIINIVMKSDVPLGTHGTITAQGGSSGRYGGTLRLNHSPGDLSVYGSYAIRRNYRNRISTDARAESTVTATPSLSSNYRDDLSSGWSPFTHLITLGVDYRIDEWNSVGATTTYFQNSFSRDDHSERLLGNAANVTLRDYDRNGSGREFDKENSVSASFHHIFSEQDHKLHIDFTSSGSPEGDDYRFTNIYVSPTFPTSFDNSRIKLRDGRSQVSVDYSNPITGTSSIEAGYIGEISHNNLDFYAENFDPVQNQFIPDSTNDKISSYGLTESIHSLYFTYQVTVGDFGILAGLRGERDSRESNLRSLDSVISTRYLTLFPSIHLTYSLSRATRLKLSYNRRVSRPKARELNPFKEYRDPKNISYGNPLLLPEDIHAVELGVQFQKGPLFVVPSLFYRYTSNNISSIKEFVNRSTLVTRKQNVSSNRAAGLEVIGSWRASRLITTHVSTTGFYEELDARNIGFGQYKSKLSWSGTVTLNVNLAARSRLEVHSHFSSVRLTPQGDHLPSSVVNVGFRQGLFGGKVSLFATVSDVFNSLKKQSDLDIPRLHQTVINTRDSRIVYLGFTFRFGTYPKREKEEEFHYEDEDESE